MTIGLTYTLRAGSHSYISTSVRHDVFCGKLTGAPDIKEFVFYSLERKQKMFMLASGKFLQKGNDR